MRYVGPIIYNDYDYYDYVITCANDYNDILFHENLFNWNFVVIEFKIYPIFEFGVNLFKISNSGLV